MRTAIEMIGELALLGLGLGGLWLGLPMPAVAATTLFLLGLLFLVLRLLHLTFVSENQTWPLEPAPPRPAHPGPLDYAKALVAWLLAYRRTYALAPGLYYTGERYDPDAPVLVTANYHLTVFLLARRLSHTPTRLLVIDTDGINVWCSASKGRFGNTEIERQLDRYPELRSGEGRLPLILPKFGLSGIDLRSLRSLGVRPIIGPLYAKDLPAWIAAPPYRDQAQDRVRFGLQSRLFVLLPGLLQIAAISATMAGLLWLVLLPWANVLPLGIVGLTVMLGTVYPVLYPWLPGRRFAVKGLALGALGSVALGAAYGLGWLPGSTAAVAVAVLFTLASAILVGLEFTGNSAVSNYSRVKREIARFLPLSATLYLAALATYIATGVSS